MFVTRGKYEFLRGQHESLKLYVAHLERLVEHERNRAHPDPVSVAEVAPTSPAPELPTLPYQVERAVNEGARPGSDAHRYMGTAAHNLLQRGLDPDEVTKILERGDRSFDALLKVV